MAKIVFVVLHYKVIDITVECIENLLKQNYSNYRILVIDNCSNNGSYEKLRELYGENELIEIISLERNYGFAKGNDVGYIVAKHQYKADFVVVINNDLMIEDTEFCNKLIDLPFDIQVGIIGPDIVNKNGLHQNPSVECIVSKKQLKKAILYTKIKLKLIPILYHLRSLKKELDNMANLPGECQRNVPLHGSCLIFARPFIDRVEYAFYPDTFLYGEEEFLFYIVRSMELETLYLPSLVVKHLEDVSTDSIKRKPKEKRIFELKNSLKSLRLLEQIWD